MCCNSEWERCLDRPCNFKLSSFLPYSNWHTQAKNGAELPKARSPLELRSSELVWAIDSESLFLFSNIKVRERENFIVNDFHRGGVISSWGRGEEKGKRKDLCVLWWALSWYINLHHPPSPTVIVLTSLSEVCRWTVVCTPTWGSAVLEACLYWEFSNCF